MPTVDWLFRAFELAAAGVAYRQGRQTERRIEDRLRHLEALVRRWPRLEREDRKTSEALADAIASLPEREKLVVTLYYYEGLRQREIAEILGVSPSRVSQIHVRATRRIRASVESERA
jgi:RNA polymerase sigma factor (sigma-70 family)